MRRITAAINQDGVKIGKFQVRRLMKEQGLVAIAPKRLVPKTTDSKGTIASPNLLRNVKLEECAPTEIINGDITYIPLQDGSWCYWQYGRIKSPEESSRGSQYASNGFRELLRTNGFRQSISGKGVLN